MDEDENHGKALKTFVLKDDAKKLGTDKTLTDFEFIYGGTEDAGIAGAKEVTGLAISSCGTSSVIFTVSV